ncbi:centromere protein S [Helicoverpa armigera]|uniref:centromere protein S n=1 Tax=Helicoverpa armigera TaxID=29058 RepID=UPI003082E7F6
MTSFDSLSSSQKSRAALHRDVRSIGTETCHFLGLEITKAAMEIVAELVYKKLLLYGADLEAFAKHAKRATINAEDVKLLVRRCPSLKSHLNTIAPSPKEKKRKTVGGRASEASTPNQKDSELSTSKQKGPEIATSIPKETEIPTWTRKEPESKQKDVSEQEDKEIESMVIDDMIDLTFD